MRNKALNLIGFALCAVSLAHAVDAPDQQCNPAAPPGTDPGGDNPDDTASAASPDVALPPPESGGALVSVHAGQIGLVQSGFHEAFQRLVERLQEAPIVVQVGADARPLPVLLVPSGGLAGLAESRQVRDGLASYVAGGGTLVVFSQQRGVDYSVLPTPGGEPIGAWGWSEDNSCYYKAAYVETFHPLLASQSEALVTTALDGFFDSIPDESIVLLRRVKNGLPAMFMYPYGAGWVVVSASYDDWGGYNQAGFGARAIIRDTLAWAKSPADLPLHSPGSSAAIALDVFNASATDAGQIKLTLFSPSRDRVLDTRTVSLAVPSGATVDAPYEFAFPALAELGIYRVDYELLDAGGETAQPMAEADSGRIVVARPPPSPYRPADLSASLVMPDGETIVAGDDAVFRYRLTNRADVERHLRTYWEITHAQATLAHDIVVPAHATVERDVTAPAAALRYGGRFWLHVFEQGGVPHPLNAILKVTGETGAYQLSDSKGFRTLQPGAEVTAVPERTQVEPGETLNIAPVGKAIPAAMERYRAPGPQLRRI